MIEKKLQDIKVLEFELLSFCSGISHFITTRNGSLPDDAYSSMNLCDYTGDNPAHVAYCRQQMASVLSIEPTQFVFPHQVHGTSVGLVDSSDFQGDYDALITDRPGICIGVSTADCVPILLYSPKMRVVAAVHAGWRGTVQRIASKTVSVMSSHYGCLPDEILACIGPSIGPDAFEVGEEVADSFRRAGFSDVCQPRAHANPHVDLWQANLQDLTSCGVVSEHIQIAGICTYANPDYLFSARKLGIRSGRIASAIMLR
jgi:uncharacterized protein, YfiH family